MNNKLVIVAVILVAWVVASTYNNNPDDSNVPYLLRERIVEPTNESILDTNYAQVPEDLQDVKTFEDAFDKIKGDMIG